MWSLEVLTGEVSEEATSLPLDIIVYQSDGTQHSLVVADDPEFTFMSGHTDIFHVGCSICININNSDKYSWTSLCRSGRDPEKFFDIGMVRDNQLGVMGMPNKLAKYQF